MQVHSKIVGLVVAVAILATAPLTNASVGSLTTSRIANDSVQTLDYSATWNPKLPKLVTDGTWEYAVFTRYDTSPSGIRYAWIFKRRLAPAPPGEWEPATASDPNLMRYFVHVHQHPGLALERGGDLHVAFDCLPPYRLCTSGGASSQGTLRFYDLIFDADYRDPDGSLHLGSDPDAYSNYNEHTAESYGYIGLGTDPTVSRTFVSLANNTWDQVFFRAGIFMPPPLYVPHQFASTDLLYPQIPISPTGKRYYIVNELRSDWQTFPGAPDERLRSFAYKGFALYTVSSTLSLRYKTNPPVSDPDGVNRFASFSDASFGPDGRLYVLFIQKPAVNGKCSYLLKETSPGSGNFSAPLPAGCHNTRYPQLQVDSAGTINILEGIGLDLVVTQSTDGGLTWQEQPHRTVPISNNGDIGVPGGSQGIIWPTLVKPWNSPLGYQPNVLHGMLANWSRPGIDDTGGRSWSASEFSIPVGP